MLAMLLDIHTMLILLMKMQLKLRYPMKNGKKMPPTLKKVQTCTKRHLLQNITMLT